MLSGATADGVGRRRPQGRELAVRRPLDPVTQDDGRDSRWLNSETASSGFWWRVRSASAGGTPQWTEIYPAPASNDGLVGELPVESDGQIMHVYFEDVEAQERVTRAAHDAAAIAQER